MVAGKKSTCMNAQKFLNQVVKFQEEITPVEPNNTRDQGSNPGEVGIIDSVLWMCIAFICFHESTSGYIKIYKWPTIISNVELE